MVFNSTFNNISVLSWQSVLFVEETGVPGENHQPAASHWQTLNTSHSIRNVRVSIFIISFLSFFSDFLVTVSGSSYLKSRQDIYFIPTTGKI
jgi:hypothetical protein